jgi:hypothetical protein
MNRSSLLRRLAAPLVGAALVSGLVVASTGSASAATIGSLTFNGLTSQAVSFSVTTSAACPSTPTLSTNFIIKITGGNLPATPTFMNGNTAGSTVGGITDAPFTAGAQLVLQDFAANNGLVKLGDGTYTTTLVCRQAIQSASLGDFVGQFTVSNSGATVTPVIPSAGPAATTTTLTPATVTPAWGALTNYVVTVGNNVTATDKPIGTVQLKDGGVDVPGATAPLVGGTATIPAALGLGAHTLSAAYTTGDAAKYSSSVSGDTVVTVALAAPTVIRPATISGVARVGGSIICGTGTWSGATSYIYEIRRNGVAVQTSTTDFDRALAVADLNATFSCAVTGVNPIGNGTPSVTGGLKVAAGAAPVAKTRPTITGSTIVGRSLIAGKGTWSPTATYTYRYQWKRNGISVRGATAATYRVSKADKGRIITVVVTATRTGYLAGSVSSLGVRVR